MKHDGHVTETPDVSYIKNVDVTHEVSDVYVSGIVKFLAALTVLTVATFFFMWGFFRVLEKQETEPERSPMAQTEKDRLPPEPRLQSAPGFAEDLEKAASIKKEETGSAITAGASQPKDALYEINILQAHWKDLLEHGPVDQSGRRYGMPIEKAKEEILKQGLPVRGQTADSRKQ
ncbi:MAG: hypothetical protein QOK48_2713 [Blastocatellia bacterium]|jgi:hypothetical protein|nr:hypothetical protein [Blastocatellia bacterium]